MQLRTFGSLVLDGTDFTRPKPLLLLCYLALEGAQERRFLAELFWPQARDHMKSLTVALSRLRKGAAGAVEADEARAWTTLESDAAQFLAHLEQGDIVRVLEPYQGSFLEGIYLRDIGSELEEWIYQTREFFAAHARQALITVARREALRGRFAEAGGRAEQAYTLSGAPALEPDDLQRLYPLLRAADSPQARGIQIEARDYGLELTMSRAEAREQLSRASTTGHTRHNLPATSTHFVGRDVELAEVASLLMRPDCRLLTLLGPAGVGKTRLATQIAWEQLAAGAFEDGLYLVLLEPLSSVAAIPTILADLLGLELKGAENPSEQLIDAIGEQQMLVVLDNFEHLMDAALMIAEWLRRCPNLTLLVTSRERLNVEQEYVFPVAGLTFPGRDDLTPAQAQRHDAVNLFVQRAKRAQTDFALTATTLPAVLKICRLVEGLPLGLELSAVWLRVMPVHEIARELANDLDLLTTPARNVPERHRSLRAAFEQSWKRLSATEQCVLQSLAIFQGGFGREAARDVAGATIPMLAALADKSLMRADLRGRYDLHPLLRQYLADKLVQRPSAWSQTQERHARYYLGLLRRCAAGLQGGAQRAALDTLDKEQENLRLAWFHATSQRWFAELQTAAETVSHYYLIRARPQPGLELFSEAVTKLSQASEPDSLTLGTMLVHQAWFFYLLRRFEDASHAALQGLALLKSVHPPQGMAKALNTLGVVAWKSGEYDKASAYYHEALAAIGDDPDAQVRLLGNLAIVEHFQGHYPRARQYYQQVLSYDRAQGNIASAVQALNNLGHLHLDAAALSEAEACFNEALELARTQGIERITPNVLSGLATVALERGEQRDAQQRFRDALTLAQEIGNSTDHAVISLKLARSLSESEPAKGLHYARRGLATAWAIKDLATVLHALTVFAEYALAHSRVIRAAKLAVLVAHHPVTKHSDRVAAERLISRLHGKLPAGDRSTTLEGEKTLDLAKTVEALVQQPEVDILSQTEVHQE